MSLKRPFNTCPRSAYEYTFLYQNPIANFTYLITSNELFLNLKFNLNDTNICEACLRNPVSVAISLYFSDCFSTARFDRMFPDSKFI